MAARASCARCRDCDASRHPVATKTRKIVAACGAFGYLQVAVLFGFWRAAGFGDLCELLET